MFGTKIFEERKSKYNGHLRVVKSLGLGTYIQANGLTQSGGVVEQMWRQTIKHITYNIKQRPKNILILGLGGGTLVKILKKYFPESKITGIDIDKEVIELGQKYLKTDLKGVDVKIVDALSFVSKLKPLSSKLYDLIIVDLYNGDQFPKKFESNSFLELIHKLIPKNGIVIFNRLYYKDKKLEAENFGNKLKNYFNEVEYYRPITNLMFVCTG